MHSRRRDNFDVPHRHRGDAVRALSLVLLAILSPLALVGASSTTHESWDGNTATVACIFAGNLLYAVGCPRVEEESMTWRVLPDGATRVAGVLTFEPRSPAQRVMHVFIQAFDEEMRPPVAYREFSGEGTIPFDVDLTTMPAALHHELSIHGDYRFVQQGNAGVVIEVAQPFHVEMDVQFAD